MLGLPARLAFTALVMVFLSVGVLAAWADVRMREATDAAAVDTAVSTARSVSTQFIAGEAGAVDESVNGLIQSRLQMVDDRDPSVRGAAVWGRGGDEGELTLRASVGEGFAESADTADLEQALDELEPVSELSGDGVATAWVALPAANSGVGVLGLEVKTDAAATLGRDRMLLWLGAALTASLLGALLLILLQRELFRPLQHVRRVMAQIGSGAKGVRIGWSRGDELGVVADTFDEMVAELELAQEELAGYVTSDPLTGLLNAETFTDRFAAELTRARREGYPVTLAMLEADGIKEIAHAHDRDAVDDVLRRLGAVVGGSVRPTDVAGRVGEARMAIALVGADAAQAAVVVERVRAEVAAQVVVGPDRTRVSCSFGVAEYPRHAVDQIALERMAGAALEHARRGGQRGHAIAFGERGGYVPLTELAHLEAGDAMDSVADREMESALHAMARATGGLHGPDVGHARTQAATRAAIAITRQVGWADAEVRRLRSAASLADVGVVALSPAMREAALAGDAEALTLLDDATAWMLEGAGLDEAASWLRPLRVPFSEGGSDLPEATRVLQAARAWEAMAHERREDDAVRSALADLAGSTLDPDMVDALLAAMDAGDLVVGTGPDEEHDATDHVDAPRAGEDAVGDVDAAA